MAEQRPPRLAIIGAGSWGTALAISLARRFASVHLWTHDAQRAAEIAAARENKRYLPGYLLPANLSVTSEIGAAVDGFDIALLVVPSRYLRSVAAQLRPHVRSNMRLVSATKGIEEGTFFRMSQLIADALGPALSCPVAVLSGPTFAKEIAAGEPAAVVIACQDRLVAEEIQRSFATPSLRFYASTDVVGVELGAALKNVIAIGAGICRGLGLGSNSVAALVTRGLAEITRLAVELGGSPRTLSGLAGLGDLLLTATGDLSRNRHVGIELGKGRKLEQILSGMTMVAEGVETCRAAYHLGESKGIALPIIGKMYQVLYEAKDPREAIRELMDRPLTTE
jgi:glycerol-3-phosphate dehydrogenase (NAD(P)+)